MQETITIEFDGGSRGNPGPAGIGVVLRVGDGTALVTLGRFIGHATNNVAEYHALIAGLEQALALGAKRVEIRGDSELIVKQMKGEYRVRHPDLQPLHAEAQKLIQQFAKATLQHNLRHKNKLADRLANLAMDRKGEVTEADEAGEEGLPPRSAQDSVDAPSAEEQKVGDGYACARCGCAFELTRASRIRPHQYKAFVCVCGGKMGRSGV